MAFGSPAAENPWGVMRRACPSPCPLCCSFIPGLKSQSLPSPLPPRPGSEGYCCSSPVQVRTQAHACSQGPFQMPVVWDPRNPRKNKVRVQQSNVYQRGICRYSSAEGRACKCPVEPATLDHGLGNTRGGIKTRLGNEIPYLTYSEGVTLDRCPCYLNL